MYAQNQDYVALAPSRAFRYSYTRRMIVMLPWGYFGERSWCSKLLCGGFALIIELVYVLPMNAIKNKRGLHPNGLWEAC